MAWGASTLTREGLELFGMEIEEDVRFTTAKGFVEEQRGNNLVWRDLSPYCERPLVSYEEDPARKERIRGKIEVRARKKSHRRKGVCPTSKQKLGEKRVEGSFGKTLGEVRNRGQDSIIFFLRKGRWEKKEREKKVSAGGKNYTAAQPAPLRHELYISCKTKNNRRRRGGVLRRGGVRVGITKTPASTKPEGEKIVGWGFVGGVFRWDPKPRFLLVLCGFFGRQRRKNQKK